MNQQVLCAWNPHKHTKAHTHAHTHTHEYKHANSTKRLGALEHFKISNATFNLRIYENLIKRKKKTNQKKSEKKGEKKSWISVEM